VLVLAGYPDAGYEPRPRPDVPLDKLRVLR
jgi:hypothetical protein